MSPVQYSAAARGSLSRTVLAHGLLVALLAAGPACAATTASATITGLTVTLTDLDPNDGIAPALKLRPGVPPGIDFQMPAQTSVQANGLSATWPGGSTNPPSVTPPLVPLSISWASGGDSASASLGGASLSSSASVATDGAVVAGSSLFGGALVRCSILSCVNGGYWQSVYVLTPETQITFTAQYDVAIHTDAGRASLATFATASMGMLPGTGIWTEGDGPLFFEQQFRTVSGTLGPSDEEQSGTISITFPNALHRPMPFGFSVGTNVQIDVTDAPPVPEPGGALLMLGGLSALAIGARARRTRPLSGS